MTAGPSDDDLCTLLRELIRCKSVNPPGDEALVADALERFLRAYGVETWRGEVLPGRPNLYARAGSKGPVLLLNGHMDTVPAGEAWTRGAFEGELADGRIYGRGAADMKAGLAACAVTLARLALRADVPAGSVLLAAVVDEECGARGARHAVDLDGIRADAAIVAEPTDMRLVTSTNGQLNFTLRLSGRAAHSSEPALGHSAIGDAARLTQVLEACDPPFLVGSIHGGVAANVVPASCELRIDRRLGVHERLEKVEAEFARIVADLTAGAPSPAEYDVTLAVPPVALEDGHPVTTAIAQAVGQSPPFGHSEQTMDASWFAEAGIPTVVLGPGDPSQAHQADEHVLVEDLVAGTRELEQVALAILETLSRIRVGYPAR
jgi:succinyl-diaminopimelate desuccinylase